MEEAISFFRAFEFWIYLIIGLGVLFFLRRFVLAWAELKNAAFGLERESAQAQLNQSAVMLVVLLTLAIFEFVLVYFVSPTTIQIVSLPTPTLNPLASPTITLPAITSLPGDNVAAAPVQPAEIQSANCVPGQLEISVPQNNTDISGVVSVIGTADIPNFGFYKLEIKRPEEAVWLTLQAGNSIVQNEKLGDWDTRRLTPGEYQLGLVAVDNQAQASQPCTINIRVFRAEESETP